MRTLLVVLLVLAGIGALDRTLSAEPLPPAAPTPTFDVAHADRDALAVLMDHYQPATGRYGTGWWTSATITDSVIRYEQVTGDRSELPEIEHTFAVNPYLTDWGYGGTRWTNHYDDDSLWWALAWLHGYQLTGDPAMLTDAENIAGWARQFWTLDCGGGVQWAVGIVQNGEQKNAITNALYLRLNAELYSVTHRLEFERQAQAEAAWLPRLRMPDGTLADHLTMNGSCRPTGGYATYSQGEAAIGLAETGDMPQAQAIADAVVRKGIAQDGCEPDNCGMDEQMFKGPLVDGIGALNALLPAHPYSTWLLRNATAAYTDDRAQGNLYGVMWSGPVTGWYPDNQAAVIDLYTACLEAH